MNDHKFIDNRSKLADNYIPGNELRKKLLISHLTIAAVGLVMLIVALFSTVLLRSETLSFIDKREPTVHASTLVLVGLERSLAALRGWIVLGDPAFKHERANAWKDEIGPAVDTLQQLSKHWSDKEDNARLLELIRTLEEHKEAQWWIEDVAQTPGNKPAQLMLEQNVQPIVSDLITAATALIEVEKSLQNGVERKVVQWLMVDIQQSFTQAEMILSDFVHTGSSTKVENFKINLYGAKQQLQELEIRLKQLNPEQRELLTFLLQEIAIFEFYSSKLIDIRQSREWDVARNLMRTEALPRARIAYTLARTFSVNQIKRMHEEADFITSVSNIAISLLFGLIFTMVLVAWIVSKRGAERITQPISILSLATRKLAKGLLVADIPVTSDDELGHLTQSFNEMRTSLQQSRNDLNRQNTELEQEIKERKRMEKALHNTYDQLEIRVQERTVELAESNQALQAEMNEHKQAEEKLQTLSSAIEQSPNAVLITDVKGIIEYINPKFTQLTGYTPKDIIGKNPNILKSGNTSAEIYKALWDVIRSGGVWRGEIQDKKISGELYWAFESISPIRNKQNVITHYLAIQKDISVQKRAEEALQASLERFQQVADMAGEWIWEQDASGHYTYSSSAVKDILGYEAEEITGKSYIDLFTEEDRKHLKTISPETNNVMEHAYRLINHYQHKNGYEVFTESTGIPLLNAQGKVIKWRGVERDITARKRFEDAVNLRDRAIEAARVGIVITDALQENNPVIYVNSALCDITGYSHDELIGQSLLMLQSPRTDPVAIEEIRHAIKEKRSYEVILRNYRKDGTLFWNEFLISPVWDERGKLMHFIGVLSDVTELRHAEEERHELEIAKQIQQSLLPKESLSLKNVIITGSCLPASHVGGDYFDYFYAGETIDVVIADVSGHSVGAALIMAETRSTLRAETSRHSKLKTSTASGAADILQSLNELLYDDLNRAEMFITMFYIKYHTRTGQLNYANAGHNRALLLRHNENNCTQLDTEGLILGVRSKVAFEEKTLNMDKGDILMLYTDGITEAQNRQGEFFGITRLCNLFASYENQSPHTIIDNILEEVEGFCQTSSFVDDISMVVLKVR